MMIVRTMGSWGAVAALTMGAWLPYACTQMLQQLNGF
jgi:hypothetical protein